jgi:hypothetical protein
MPRCWDGMHVTNTKPQYHEQPGAAAKKKALGRASGGARPAGHVPLPLYHRHHRHIEHRASSHSHLRPRWPPSLALNPQAVPLLQVQHSVGQHCQLRSARDGPVHTCFRLLLILWQMVLSTTASVGDVVILQSLLRQSAASSTLLLQVPSSNHQVGRRL